MNAERPPTDQPLLRSLPDDPVAPLRAAVRLGAIGALVLAIVSVAVSTALRGTPGLWGALLGSAVGAGFVLATGLTVLLTSKSSPATTGAVVLGGWFVKIVTVMVVVLVLQGLDFYDHTVFGVVVLVAAIGALAIETTAVLRSRTPYVTPAPSPESGSGN